jgi:hypothetical protein
VQKHVELGFVYPLCGCSDNVIKEFLDVKAQVHVFYTGLEDKGGQFTQRTPRKSFIMHKQFKEDKWGTLQNHLN